MFREMNVIAAVAYAAQRAACAEPSSGTFQEMPLWSELDDDGRKAELAKVGAIMRGEDAGNDVFNATARAILAGPNGDGHGELALEEIAKLGDYMLNANLLTVEEAQQGGSIVGHAITLLEQLATIKSMFVPLEVATEEAAAAAAVDQAAELANDDWQEGGNG